MVTLGGNWKETVINAKSSDKTIKNEAYKVIIEKARSNEYTLWGEKGFLCKYGFDCLKKFTVIIFIFLFALAALYWIRESIFRFAITNNKFKCIEIL